MTQVSKEQDSNKQNKIQINKSTCTLKSVHDFKIMML